MCTLPNLGAKLRSARQRRFPADDMRAFAIRIGVSRATLQKMEKGDLRVSMNKYYAAAEILGTAAAFDSLFEIEASLFDD